METKDIPDVQLKELLAAIQRDGVDKARQESEALLQKAKARAEEIVADARAQADVLLANARGEQERLARSGRESLKQASRDLLLGVRKQLETLFAALLQEKSREALGEKAVTDAIAVMIANWTPERQDKLELVLPPDRFDALAKALRRALGEKIAAGIAIKASAEVADGFRVAEKDGHAYYDFSAASIAENLSLFLNPAMAKVIADALSQDV